MEIPASIFFGIWSSIGAVSLYFGFNALNNTDLPASVPPAVLFLFKHFLAISASHSSARTLVFHTKLKIHVLKFCALFFLVFLPMAFLSITGEALAISFRIYSLVNAFLLIYYFLPWKKRVLGDDFFYYLSLGFILFPLLLSLPPSRGEDSFLMFAFTSISNFFVIFQPSYAVDHLEDFCLYFHLIATYNLLLTTQLSPILVLIPSFFTCIAHAAIAGDEGFERFWPHSTILEQNRILSEVKKTVEKNVNVIEYAVGMGGMILFQYFFRLTTFDHVAAFLYFAVAWLANVALLLCPHDFGVFNFFLSNVIVGCTVSQFGVGRITWVAYAAALLLYLVRVKLELICVVRRDGKPAFVTWRQNEITETDQMV